MMTFRDIVKNDMATRELEEKFNPKRKWLAVYQSPDGYLFCRHERTGVKPTINDDDVEIYRIGENNED